MIHSRGGNVWPSTDRIVSSIVAASLQAGVIKT
jgi:hypothetical protein